MASLAILGLKALGVGKKIVSWEGFRSWKFWAGAAVAVGLGWLIITNMVVSGQNRELLVEQKAQEARIEQAIDNNQELHGVIARLQVGAVVDSSVIVSNQKELDRIRKEHDEREAEINRQDSSGPAGAATVCAITGVCPQ